MALTAFTAEEFQEQAAESLRLLDELKKLAPKASLMTVGLLGVALIEEAVRRSGAESREWWVTLVRSGRLPPGTVVVVQSDERKG